MRKSYTLDEQYEAYKEKYYETLRESSVDFTRPLTKGEYRDARASYIADKISEGKKIYPSNINRDLVNRSKDYAMSPAQARAYKKALAEKGIKVKFKTLRENKAIKGKLDEDIKTYYKARKKQYQEKGQEIPTDELALEIGEYFFGS